MTTYHSGEHKLTTDELKQVALAYTVKTSSADSPEQFLEDYLKNLEQYTEITKKDSKWLV